MRHWILAAIVVLTAPSAMASSIEIISGPAGANGSIVTLSCPSCPALRAETRKPDYTVPQLTEGTQRIEVRDVDGKKQLLRTEAWLGGSPVVFVSQSETWLGDSALAEAKPADNQDGIDMGAKTAAVGEPSLPAGPHDGPGRPMVASMAPPAPAALNLSDFNLRLE